MVAENNSHPLRVSIIGGGAAGCFAAIFIARSLPDARVTVYEAGAKPLAKVAVTGGGRCNLTNSFEDVKSMEAVYPRGHRLMKRQLKEFGWRQTMEWFEQKGVRLTVQDDHCVFPLSQNAMEIVSTLQREMRLAGVTVMTRHRVKELLHDKDQSYRLRFSDPCIEDAEADYILVTTGGWPKHGGDGFLSSLQLKIEPPVPALFGICLPESNITSLTGTVVEEVTLGITGTRLHTTGPLLITHWGLSGPATLKLSSHGARQLYEQDYQTEITVNWLGNKNEEEAMETVYKLAIRHPAKQLASVYPDCFNSRLWTFLLQKSGLNPEQRWSELARKSYNKLVNTLINDHYHADGRNRFKEEFVTCGGVSLSNINPNTMECKSHPRLFFAGEVLDIDAVTGGFNLQAAWTTAHRAALSIAESATVGNNP